MNYGHRLHPDDATSTFLTVKKLEEESYNPIIVYKPQGSKVVIGPTTYDDIDLTNDIFAIGIQTKEQLEMFVKHAHKIVCIDGTHKTNQYEFPLINLLVPDEFNKGYPVGHLICNRSDELVLRPFFEEIKKRCPPDLKIGALMTDDDNSGWNAFRAVFGDDFPHFLCIWHVHRTWRRNLGLVEDLFRHEVYTGLLALLKEESQNVFVVLLSGFLDLCAEKSKAFFEYFRDNYSDRAALWALCYRDFEHAKCDTNMFVESFHNRLKTFYMDRKPNKRLDDLINLLLSIEEDDYWRHKRDLIYNVGSFQVSMPRHKRGIAISNDDIEIDEFGWRLISQTQGNSLIYTVIKVTESCDDESCINKCLEVACLGLCEHLYKCDCKDSSPLCKHIHKVFSMTSTTHQDSLEETQSDGVHFVLESVTLVY